MSDVAGSAESGARLVADPEVLAIEVEEEMVLFHAGTGRFFGLRGAAGLIWQKIAAGVDRESVLAEEIVAEHDGDADHIRADVAKAIASMRQSGILVGG